MKVDECKRRRRKPKPPRLDGGKRAVAEADVDEAVVGGISPVQEHRSVRTRDAMLDMISLSTRLSQHGVAAGAAAAAAAAASEALDVVGARGGDRGEQQCTTVQYGQLGVLAVA